MSVQLNFFQTSLKKLRQSLVAIGVFSFFMNILMLTIPIYMMQLFDRVLPANSPDTLIYLTIIAIFALIIMTLLDIVRTRIGQQISAWLDKTLSPRALAHSADELLAGHPYGGQSLQDISALRQFVGSNGLFSFFDAPWIPIYLLACFMLHISLGLVATVGALVLFCFAFYNDVSTKAASAKSNAHALKLKLKTDSTLRNVEVIQAMGMLPNVIKRWFAHNEEVLALQNDVNYRSAFIMACSKGVRMSLQLLILGVGAYFAMQNQITPGAMIAASILMGRALAPVEQAIGVWKQFQRSREAYHRLNAHFERGAKVTEGVQLPPIKGELKAAELFYVPPHATKPTLRNVNFHISAGRSVAIIGPSAAGKSTLARLIIGSLPASSGSMRVDDADVYQWDRVDFGRQVGYLPQDIELFDGTIKDNIARLGAVDDEAVVAAATLAGIHQMILGLPLGYDTEISAESKLLSGGQIQRLGFARALYKKPQLLVLDEPDASLDTEGETALLNAINVMKGLGATVVLITHHPEILSVVDDVIVLRDGTVTASGVKADVFSALKKQAVVKNEVNQ